MAIDRRQAAGLREGFDEWAAFYDEETRGPMRWSAPAKLAGWLAPRLGDGERILDLGCGTGQAPEYFPSRRLRWTGADLSSEMLRLARQSGAYDELRKMNVERRRYPFPARHFDAVTASGVFEFTDRLDRALGEIRRILKPAGWLAFTVEAPPKSGDDFDVFDSDEYYYIRYRYGMDRVRGMLDRLKFETPHAERIAAYIDDDGEQVYYNCFLCRRV